VVRVPSWPLPHPRREVRDQLRIVPLGARAAVRRALDARPDVVHVHFVTPLGWIALAEARRRAIPALGTNHALPAQALEVYGRAVRTRAPGVFAALERATWWHIARFYNRCNAMTAPTAAALALYRRRGVRARSHVVSNGADVARFAAPAPPGERDAFCAHHGIPPERAIVLYVGRMNPEKRVDLLLDAFARVPDGAHLVLCGGPPGEAAREVARRGLGARVAVAGVLDPDRELPAAYRSAALLAHASEIESQGIVFLEAMAAGIPVVAADAVAVGETVIDGETGLLCPVGDAAALAAAIARLLADPALRAHLGEAGRRRAAPHALDRSVDAIEGLLAELAAR
jgi:glycosyltransferase involved in cell wall biosynthesis